MTLTLGVVDEGTTIQEEAVTTQEGEEEPGQVTTRLLLNASGVTSWDTSNMSVRV